MPGLGGGERDVDGLRVAHLAHQNHVGILPQRGAQGAGKGAGVPPHFTLVHKAGLVPVEVLDGVLNGDDVAAPLPVDHIYHSGQRGRLAAARGPGGQHQAALALDQLAHRLGYTQLLKGGDGERKGADGHRIAAPLLEDIGAETAHAGPGERKIHFAVALQNLPLRLAHALLHERFRILLSEGGHALYHRETGVDAHHGGAAHRGVEIGRFGLKGVFQQVVQRYPSL